MKKKMILSLLICFSFCSYGLTFNIPLPHDESSDTHKMDKLVFQAIIDTGYAVSGYVSNQIGLRDCHSFFIKPAFHINRFGIGFDFRISFHLYPGNLEFKTNEWYIAGDQINTLFLYLDKINYIKYGSKDYFLYARTGDVFHTTFGSGLLVNQFHNQFLVPVKRENGLYFQFNGTQLKKKFPLSVKMIIPDLLDPDIYLLEAQFDILKYLNKQNFNLKTGLIFASDWDAAESNLLSAQTVAEIGPYRSHALGAAVLGFSLPVQFQYIHPLFKLLVDNEPAGLVKFHVNSPYPTSFSFANLLKLEGRFVNLKKSGYLIAAILGLTLKYNDFNINYFSSNYQIVRQSQFYDKIDLFNVYFHLGFGILALFEDLKFFFHVIIPAITNSFQIKLATSLVFEGKNIHKIIPGIFAAVYFETSMTTFPAFTGSNGGYLIEAITRNFRFSVKLGYKIYGVKINIFATLQRANWSRLADYAYGYSFLLDEFGSDIVKIAGLEVSFVL